MAQGNARWAVGGVGGSWRRTQGQGQVAGCGGWKAEDVGRRASWVEEVAESEAVEGGTKWEDGGKYRAVKAVGGRGGGG